MRGTMNSMISKKGSSCLMVYLLLRVTSFSVGLVCFTKNSAFFSDFIDLYSKKEQELQVQKDRFQKLSSSKVKTEPNGFHFFVFLQQGMDDNGRQLIKIPRQSESNRRPKDNRATLQSSALPLSYGRFQTFSIQPEFIKPRVSLLMFKSSLFFPVLNFSISLAFLTWMNVKITKCQFMKIVPKMSNQSQRKSHSILLCALQHDNIHHLVSCTLLLAEENLYSHSLLSSSSHSLQVRLFQKLQRYSKARSTRYYSFMILLTALQVVTPAMLQANMVFTHLGLKILLCSAISIKGNSILKRILRKKLPKKRPVASVNPKSIILLQQIFLSVVVICSLLNIPHHMNRQTNFHLQSRISLLVIVSNWSGQYKCLVDLLPLLSTRQEYLVSRSVKKQKGFYFNRTNILCTR